MVSPDEIFRKAENLYNALVRAHVAGDHGFFPRHIPCRRDPAPGEGVVAVAAAVQRLRECSKERVGHGYSIRWREVNSRRYGKNLFPDRISFETEADFIRFIRKEREFDVVKNVVLRLKAALPELHGWMLSNPASLGLLASNLEGLIEVVAYLRRHPRPDRFARELPLSVDTKFIERHKDLLRRWLDLTLPPHTIRADEEHFERRYGLRYAEPLVLVRFLDAQVRAELGFPCDAVSLPLHTVGAWEVRDVRVVVVENKVNLLTLPALRRTISIGGMGAACGLLRYCAWLSHCPLVYWGDIDVQGLAILSALRAIFPHTQSVMMDRRTLDEWATLRGAGTGAKPEVPRHLTALEMEAFASCADGDVRLEQERLPQALVVEQVTSLLALAEQRCSSLAVPPQLRPPTMPIVAGMECAVAPSADNIARSVDCRREPVPDE